MSQRITQNTKKRASRDFSEEDRSETTSLETEQLQKRLLKAPSASSLKCYQIVINQGT